ncbi:tRNA (adenosine(37)-N6)-threonylcarbamoyltransferase complex ATPase subunit type 1 TsaE [Acetobacter sp. LMG 32666]|uniref:tRNA (adenosine(37)-N6)-threonylcarbamoyltransferase complex ATPase subunit type 1 TsaE n=1 Tax=Acetobacter sp. LMG 32666 TaxID=2959295 RepID=UPI0030C86C09
MLLKTEADTAQLARTLAGLARAGDAILLSGPLGAGKSVFARAFLRSFCATPDMEVPSPTYTLVQAYDGPVATAYHFDLWRLGSVEELDELGWDDACEGVMLVEWPERLEDMTPPNALHITLTVGADGSRQVTLAGWPERLQSPSVLPPEQTA